MGKRKRPTPQRVCKRNGYIVKGITRRHWWDRYDRDIVDNTRQRLKAAITRDLRDAYGEDAR